MAIGHLNDGTIAVVFAVLGTEGVSVISMRPVKPQGKEPAMNAVETHNNP